ncbi:MAG: D-arabinono-1,4-lactone oxidase [Microthrixaceae bacterium]
MSDLWKNRAGNQRALVDVVTPTTEHELCELVRDAARNGTRIKAVGSGYSSSDCALTDGTLLDLTHYGRILDFDAEAGSITVQAGARVGVLSEYLWTRGWALENPGTHDRQSIAGATSTGAHGTGVRFGGLCGSISAMRLIDGAGIARVLDVDETPELLDVARVGLGALGVISTVTLSLVPAFHLHVVYRQRRFGAVVESFGDDVAGNDHFGFVYLPHTDTMWTATSERNTAPLAPPGRLDRWRTRELCDNGRFGVAARLGVVGPSLVPKLSHATSRSQRIEYNEAAHRAFAGLGHERAIAMEYAVPLEVTTEALTEVRDWIDSTGGPTTLPIEVRTSGPDDAVMSMAHGRQTGYIAVRCHRSSPYEGYFAAVEDIMAAHGGRPHWAGLHRRDAAQLAAVYPGWDRFGALRAELDPHGVFESSFTRRCLGPVGI